MTKYPLFTAPKETDHRWYGFMYRADNEHSASHRQFCENMYDNYYEYLDENFHLHFRQSTPERFSELFFLKAFLDAGWKPIQAPKRFDFAFTSEGFSGRLLVEVTTPAPPENVPIVTDPETGQRSYTAGSQERDDALSRLTGAVSSKSKIIDDIITLAEIRQDDYKIVALSGLRNSQEGVWRLDDHHILPEWLGAFLPLGALTIDIKIPRDRSERPYSSQPYHQYDEEIKRVGKTSLNRHEFLTGKYPNVDAIVFSPNMMELEQGPLSDLVGVLHNPTSNWKNERPNLGMQNDYLINLGEDQYSIEDRKLT